YAVSRPHRQPLGAPTSRLCPYTTLFRSRLALDLGVFLGLEALFFFDLAAGSFGEFTLFAFTGLKLVTLALTLLVAGFLIRGALRSEEHTSELQSRENLVCRLPLEKKDKS